MTSPQREFTGKAIISWSRSEIRQARQTQLQPVLEQLGYRLLPRPGGNFAIAGLPQEIIIKQHYWHCPATGQSGNATT
jgi:hypothetical protein